MAPSKESEALAKLFQTFQANFPQSGNDFLTRAIYDQCAQAGRPAKDVVLEEVALPSTNNNVGLRGIWFRPKGTEKSKHVMLFMHGGGFM
jgi:acetyl esterase/lipase